jgi:hypothetical protein
MDGSPDPLFTHASLSPLLLMNWRLWILGFPLCIDVMDVNRLAVNDGSAAHEATANGAPEGARFREDGPSVSLEVCPCCGGCSPKPRVDH